MRIEEARDILKRITYKDEWQIGMVERNGVAFFSIKAIEKDSTGKRRGLILIQSEHSIPIEMLDTEKEFLRWIREALINREVHEVDEWMKIDGVAPYYPH